MNVPNDDSLLCRYVDDVCRHPRACRPGVCRGAVSTPVSRPYSSSTGCVPGRGVYPWSVDPSARRPGVCRGAVSTPGQSTLQLVDRVCAGARCLPLVSRPFSSSTGCVPGRGVDPWSVDPSARRPGVCRGAVSTPGQSTLPSPV